MSNESSHLIYTGQIAICKLVYDFKDPSKATPLAIASSKLAVIITSIICPISAFINLTVFLTFYHNRSLLKRSNVFLLALSATDFFKSTITFSLFLVKEVLFLNQQRPNCVATVVIFTLELSSFGELLLCAFTLERFISLRFPIWHWNSVKKSHLVKIIFGIVFPLSLCGSQLRIYTQVGLLSNVLLFSCAWIFTIFFSVLIWWTIKERNQKVVLRFNIARNQSRTTPEEPSVNRNNGIQGENSTNIDTKF